MIEKYFDLKILIQIEEHIKSLLTFFALWIMIVHPALKSEIKYFTNYILITAVILILLGFFISAKIDEVLYNLNKEFYNDLDNEEKRRLFAKATSHLLHTLDLAV